MKFKCYILSLFLFSSIYSFGQWTKIGNDLDGENMGDFSGFSVSLSSDGSIIAIGAIVNDGNRSYSGHVRIYENQSDNWVQIGKDIDGENQGDQSGYSVSLSSDGSTVAIGAIANSKNGQSSGHVRIFENQSGDWVQVGRNIDGENANDNFGSAVSLSSDGSVVAIGAKNSSPNGTSSGHIGVYKKRFGEWMQIGKDINGESINDKSGWSVSLSNDGSILAVGAIHNSGNGINAGHVRVYQNQSDTWVQIGEDLEGENQNDNFGHSVSLSDNGKILAVGANRHGGASEGHVRVYEYQQSSWIQIGNNIDGEDRADYLGWSVSLSADGSIVAIGSLGDSKNGSDSGLVRIYKNYEGNWIKQGNDIIGQGQNDNFGYSVSLSADGSIVAGGAYLNDGNGENSGHTRIYENKSITLSNEFNDLERLDIQFKNSKIVLLTNEKLQMKIYKLNGVEIENQNLEIGIYIVKIINPKGMSLTKKILFK